MEKDLLVKHDGLTEIRFIREDAVMTGTGSSANLFLDNKPLAALWYGEKFSIWVKPDIYKISLMGSERWVSNETAFSTPDAASWKVEVDARVDRQYEVRVDFTNWTGVRLQASSVAIKH